MDVELPVNVPSDIEKTVAMAAAMKSSGLFSDKTCIQKSGVDVDPDQEMKQRQIEQEEDYQRISDSKPILEKTVEENINVVEEET